MKYKVEIVAYESYGEINLGTFDVEADNEEEAELKARKMARKKHPNLEDCQNDFFAPLNAQAVRLGAGQVVSYNLSVHHQWQLKEPGAFWVQAHGLISDFCV